MAICSDCGKEVNYRTYGGVKYATEGKLVNFIPDNFGNEDFINKNGGRFRGACVKDGQLGFKLHTCGNRNKKAAHVGERV